MTINYSKQGKRNKRAGKAFEVEVAKYMEKELKTPQNPYFKAKATPRSGGFQLDWEGDLLIWHHPLLEQCFLECKFSKKSPSVPGWYEEALDAVSQKRWIVIIYKKLNWRIRDAVVSIKKEDVWVMTKEFKIRFAISPWKNFYQMKLWEFLLSMNQVR